MARRNPYPTLRQGVRVISGRYGAGEVVAGGVFKDKTWADSRGDYVRVRYDRPLWDGSHVLATLGHELVVVGAPERDVTDGLRRNPGKTYDERLAFCTAFAKRTGSRFELEHPDALESTIEEYMELMRSGRREGTAWGQAFIRAARKAGFWTRKKEAASWFNPPSDYPLQFAPGFAGGALAQHVGHACRAIGPGTVVAGDAVVDVACSCGGSFRASWMALRPFPVSRPRRANPSWSSSTRPVRYEVMTLDNFADLYHTRFQGSLAEAQAEASRIAPEARGKHARIMAVYSDRSMSSGEWSDEYSVVRANPLLMTVNPTPRTKAQWAAFIEREKKAGAAIKPGFSTMLAEGRMRHSVPTITPYTGPPLFCSNPHTRSVPATRHVEFNDRESGLRRISLLCDSCAEGLLKNRGRGWDSPPRRQRRNPMLMVVTGNPPANVEKVKRAWKQFHHHDFNGQVRTLPPIPGGPKTMFALGTCVALDFGTGDARPSGSRPLVCCDPTDDSLWIVATNAGMNLSACAGKTLKALTYAPVRASGKEKNVDFRHDFHRPLPHLKPIGRAGKCKAALLDGGRYYVKDWIYE